MNLSAEHALAQTHPDWVGQSFFLVVLESEQQPDRSHKHQCGTELMSVTVYHSIHDGPFPLSGSGRVQTVQTPYCPTCEEKPNWQGVPIVPDAAQREQQRMPRVVDL